MSSESSHAGRRVLALFAKQPIPGRVKTRLGPGRSPEWCARVAEAFLLDMLARWSHFAADRVLVFDPASALTYFEKLALPTWRLVPQSDGDLGKRMAAFLTVELAADATKVVILGCDSPTLPHQLVEQAFGLLETADVILGPATDGGYYLLGVTRVPPIFQDIDWGTSRVFEQTLARLESSRVEYGVLPPWYDVDTPEDLHVVVEHIRVSRSAGRDPGLPHTEQILRCE